MSWNGWDTDANGNIKVQPVVGWTTATFAKGMNGGLRLEVLRSATLSDVAAVQVAMTTAQIRELSQTLARLADRLEAQLASDKPQGQAN